MTKFRAMKKLKPDTPEASSKHAGRDICVVLGLWLVFSVVIYFSLIGFVKNPDEEFGNNDQAGYYSKSGGYRTYSTRITTGGACGMVACAGGLALAFGSFRLSLRRRNKVAEASRLRVGEHPSSDK